MCQTVLQNSLDVMAATAAALEGLSFVTSHERCHPGPNVDGSNPHFSYPSSGQTVQQQQRCSSSDILRSSSELHIGSYIYMGTAVLPLFSLGHPRESMSATSRRGTLPVHIYQVPSVPPITWYFRSPRPWLDLPLLFSTPSWHTIPYNTVRNPTIPSLTITCRNIPYHTIPYHTIPYHTIPYHTHNIPYHTIPYHTIPYHTIPYHTIPYHTIPYHTIPYHTIPNP